MDICKKMRVGVFFLNTVYNNMYVILELKFSYTVLVLANIQRSILI